MPEVDDRYQPIVVAFDVENRVWIDEVGSRQHVTNAMDVCEFRLIEYLPPADQRVLGIGMAGSKAIERFLLDDIHFE